MATTVYFEGELTYSYHRSKKLNFSSDKLSFQKKSYLKSWTYWDAKSSLFLHYACRWLELLLFQMPHSCNSWVETSIPPHNLSLGWIWIKTPQSMWLSELVKRSKWEVCSRVAPKITNVTNWMTWTA